MDSSNGREPNIISTFSDENSWKISRTKVELQRQALKEHHTPVVILINIRSTDKTSPQNEHNYLKHFRKIYEEKGWITVQCTPTEDRINGGEAADIVNTLFSCIRNRGVHTNPIIMHVLGHEALPIHNAICQFAKDEQDLGNHISIKGCILDSCPKQPNDLMNSIKEFWPSVYDFLILIIYLIRAIYPELFSNDLDISDYDMFCCYAGTWPQMYFYSTVDHIVPYEGVEKVIRMRSSIGIPLEIKCWNDTEHARHLFVHEEEYTEMCHKFIEDCLRLS